MPRLLVLLIALGCLLAPSSARAMPEAEQALRHTVDPWGLPFSDQYRIYQQHFAPAADREKSPAFRLGVETPLRKTFANKYWFKGQWGGPAELAAARREAEAFQLAILPATGTTLRGVQVSADALVAREGAGRIPADAVALWRVAYVSTTAPAYPVRHVGAWPDPLIPLAGPFDLQGTDLGLIWCEIHVPEGTPPGHYTGALRVQVEGHEAQTLPIELEVWPMTLPERIPIPTLVWMTGDIREASTRQITELFLSHHIDPMSVDRTTHLPDILAHLAFSLDRGQMYFHMPGFDPKNPAFFEAYYQAIQERGWLDRALYFAADEPLVETFETRTRPWVSELRERFPGLKTYLASEHHPGMGQVADIWMTDLSANFQRWLKNGRPDAEALWFYFCHAPVRTTLDRPLFDAPNIQIDNDAIEHRLLHWMRHIYQAGGIFIWAGNWTWPKDYDGRTDEPFDLKEVTATYPHGGVHNGNGYLIYPGPFPSIRLKTLRDGIEDAWYLQELARHAADGHQEAAVLLETIRPQVLVDTHYFNRDPAGLERFRQAAGELLSKASPIVTDGHSTR